MADEVNKLGRLPAWPRKPLNNSVIAAEQAYRKRSGLPALSDADVEALKAGEQMPWEKGEAPAGAPAAAAAETTRVMGSAELLAAAATPPPPSQPISPEVAEWAKQGKKWSKSAIAAEQARRKRNNLPALNDSEVTLLMGEPPASAAAKPAAGGAAAAPKTAPSAVPPGAMIAVPIARTGAATKYVGTPAVGTSKAAAAGGVASVGPKDTPISRARRRFIWTGVVAFLGAWFVAFFRFFLPRTLFEPSTVFKIGYPSDFGMGVDTKFQQMYRIWVDRIPGRIFVIYAKCTHLGCTPDWKPAENKFKCPCHGSGYDSEGVNFEGPAPRPMDRAHVELAPDGQIIVDVAKLYQWPKGQPSQFDNPGAFLSV